MTAEEHAKRVETITEKVRTVIVEQLGCAPDTVTLEANLLEDLGCDSLDAVELTMEFEDRFDIDIPDADLGQLDGTLPGNAATVQALVDYLVQRDDVQVD